MEILHLRSRDAASLRSARGYPVEALLVESTNPTAPSQVGSSLVVKIPAYAAQHSGLRSTSDQHRAGAGTKPQLHQEGSGKIA